MGIFAIMLAARVAAAADSGDSGDSGDTADTASGDTGAGDTSVYVDTAAKSERVFVQDVGCGGGAALVLPLIGLFAAGGKRRHPDGEAS